MHCVTHKYLLSNIHVFRIPMHIPFWFLGIIVWPNLKFCGQTYFKINFSVINIIGTHFFIQLIKWSMLNKPQDRYSLSMEIWLPGHHSTLAVARADPEFEVKGTSSFIQGVNRSVGPSQSPGEGQWGDVHKLLYFKDFER